MTIFLEYMGIKQWTMDDPVCVKSSIGYVIMGANRPIMQQCKLRSETTLSTIEAKIVTLALSCCKLFPIID